MGVCVKVYLTISQHYEWKGQQSSPPHVLLTTCYFLTEKND